MVGVGRRAGAEPSAAQRLTGACGAEVVLPSGLGPLGSQNSSADFKQTRVALITSPRPAATLRLATQLLLADEGERGAEQFVLDNRSRRHAEAISVWLKIAAIKSTSYPSPPRKRGPGQPPRPLGPGFPLAQE